jgi:hypothetical protein
MSASVMSCSWSGLLPCARAVVARGPKTTRTALLSLAAIGGAARVPATAPELLLLLLLGDSRVV